MKIIKSPEKVVKCERCGCVYQYDTKDVKTEYANGCDFVECPLCAKVYAVSYEME